MSTLLQKNFWLSIRDRLVRSDEDLLVYVLLCPAFFLYVVYHRFGMVYLAPFIYLAWRLIKGLRNGASISFNRRSPVFLALGVVWSVALLSVLFREQEFLFRPMYRDVLIISGYLLLFFLPHSFQDRHVKALFLTEVAGYAIWIDYRKFDRFFSTFFSARSTTEYDMGLFFGLFFLYFLWRRDFLYLVFSLVVLLLVSKRAIYLGLAPSVAWMVFEKWIPLLKSGKVRAGFLSGVFLGLTLLSFWVVDILTWYFHTLKGGNERIDFLMNGRAFSLNFIRFKIMNSDIWHFLTGHGPGQLDVQISLYRPVHWSKYYPEPTNPHNDFLKLFYDYGLVGFLLIGMAMSRLYSARPIGVVLFLYTLILFFFDNSLIHIYYNLIAFVIFYSGNQKQDETEVHQY